MNAAGVQANGTTERPAISADGRVVAFEAVQPAATSCQATSPAVDVNDIVVRDLAAGTTAGASDPTAATGSSSPTSPATGGTSCSRPARSTTPSTTSAGNDVYRRDMVTGAIVLASAGTAWTRAAP